MANTVGTRRIDALLIYIGTNDVEVASTLENLVTGDNPILGTGNATQARLEAKQAAADRLADLQNRFDDLDTALSALNIGQVYLTEYPSGLFDDTNGNAAAGCEVFSGPRLNLSRRDAELVKYLAQRLNTAIAAAAQRHGWIFVGGIDAEFAGHGFCTPADHRYFIQTRESLLTQGILRGQSIRTQ